MTWLDMAINLAKEFEGCSLGAYPDPEYGWKVATIGYGATGPSIVEGTIWTQAQADADLLYRMKGIGAHIDSLVSIPITDEQKAAMCDLAYNIGLGAFGDSTLLKMLNVGHIQGAADQFPLWNKSNGVALDGLVRRRAAERAMFVLGSDFSKDPDSGEVQPQPEATQ